MTGYYPGVCATPAGRHGVKDPFHSRRWRDADRDGDADTAAAIRRPTTPTMIAVPTPTPSGRGRPWTKMGDAWKRGREKCGARPRPSPSQWKAP